MIIRYVPDTDIYGYDIHFDRFSDLYLPIKIKPKFIFMDIQDYDQWFKNGSVKYIIIENVEKAKKQIPLYYNNYKLFKLIGHSIIYKFEENSY